MNLRELKDLKLKVNKLTEIIGKSGDKSAGYYQFTDYFPGTKIPFIYITRNNLFRKDITLDMANKIELRNVRNIKQYE